MPLRFLLLASLLLPGVLWGGKCAWMYLSVPPEEEVEEETGEPKLVFEYSLKELDGHRVAITCRNPSLRDRSGYTNFAMNFEDWGISGGPPVGIAIQLQDMEGNAIKVGSKRFEWYSPLYRSSTIPMIAKGDYWFSVPGQSEVTLTFPLAAVAMWYFDFGSGDADFVREHERVRYRLRYLASEWRFGETYTKELANGRQIESDFYDGGKVEIVTEWREIATVELFSRIPFYDSRPHYRPPTP